MILFSYCHYLQIRVYCLILRLSTCATLFRIRENVCFSSACGRLLQIRIFNGIISFKAGQTRPVGYLQYPTIVKLSASTNKTNMHHVLFVYSVQNGNRREVRLSVVRTHA
jgi:hypothetical protein